MAWLRKSMVKAGAITTAAIADGSIGTAKLGTGCLAASAAGRAKMADDYFDAATLAAKMVLPEGNILVGNATNGPAALSAKTSGRILVGNGTTVASVAVSGDISLSAAGATAIQAGALSADVTGRAKMAANYFDAATFDAKVAANSVKLSRLATDAIAKTTVVTVPGGNGAGSVGTLSGTPVTVIAAPAAGTYIEVLSVHFFLDFATTGYDAAAAGDTLEVGYTGGAACITPVAGNTIGAAVADYHINCPGVACVPSEATAVEVRVNTGSWYAAAGDSPLKIEAIYRIRTFSI